MQSNINTTQQDLHDTDKHSMLQL